MERVVLTTRDNYPLVMHVFRPKSSSNKLLIINSATGVKQQMYFSFAKFCAENGYTVITYDYRGIGLSKPNKMKGFTANMRIWGAVDFESVTEWAMNSYRGYDKFCLGHSVGALILGMNTQSSIFKKNIFIATQKAHVSNLNWKVRLSACLGFGMAQPLLTHLFNYFPAQYLGLGESLPSGCAFDWRALILNKESTNYLLKHTVNVAQNLNQPTLFLYAQDDQWVTMKGMTTLLNDTYPNLKTSFRELKITESPQRKIGHINFFRSYNQSLWEIPLHWLEESSSI